ncbi:hypothetical protein [Psychromonas sp. MME2]|uniref:hypothetical protein n=1 Tax=unclassified Psychromonas TaxID=2614957 RepID=UPI00339CBD89
MKKLIMLTLGLMLTFNVFADAAKGQKYYLKYLRPHFAINGQEFASQHLKVEWKRLFKNDAKRFIKEYTKKFPDSAEFLNGDTFQKIAPDLADFAEKYAADSGELASCN